jgi:threonine dehydratase
VDDALVAASRFAADTGAIFVHPFNHADIVAGQGTVGLEILEACPDVATIVVATGGGGLLSGVAAAVKATHPHVRIVGVQAEGAAAFPGSLAAGEPVALTEMGTIADGIAVGRPGEVTLAHVRDLVDDIVTVSDEDISRALLLLLERSKSVVEPAGAAAVAAIMSEPHRFTAPVVGILTGGNIDPLLLLRVIEHGMAAAGRYLSFTVQFNDRPGSLASLLTLVGEEGANVLDVSHLRADPHLHLGEVDVELRVETKGTDHSAQLLTALRAGGYRVQLPT